MNLYQQIHGLFIGIPVEKELEQLIKKRSNYLIILTHSL